MPNPTTTNESLEEITNAMQAALARHGCHPSGSAVRSAWFAGLAASGPVATAGKSVTATIPMGLLEAYVALQRLVDGALFLGGNEVAYTPTRYDVDRIAAASLAISKLNNNEGK